MPVAQLRTPVAKKKTTTGDKPAQEPKRYGTLIRVSDQFADAIRNASTLEKLSMAEFADKHLLQAVTSRYRALLAAETKRIGGDES